MTDQIARAEVHLFAPRPALLAGGPSAPTSTAGRNPPAGANIYFHLARVPDSAAAVKIELLDAAGKVLRTYNRAPAGAPAPTPAPAGPGAIPTITPRAGLNSFQWDLRADPPTRLPGNINIWGGPANGYRVAPGRYQARLTVGTAVQTQPFEVRQDPRLTTPAAELAARDTLARTINTRVGEIHDALLRMRDVKEQINRFVERTKEVPAAAAIAGKGKEIVGKVEVLEPQLSTKAANGQDVINYRNGINAQYAFLLGNVEQNDGITQSSRERFAELERLWTALRAQIEQLERVEVPAFNKLLNDNQVDGVIIPNKRPGLVT